jgi:hypothetical protein
VTHYSDNPGHVRADFFKESGKWYMTETINMEPYYNELDIFVAVKKALVDSGRGDTTLMVVVLEPYHRNAYPVCIPARD